MLAQTVHDPAVEELRKVLESVRSHQKRIWFVEGAGLLAGVALTLACAAMALDNLFHLVLPIRMLLLATLLVTSFLLLKRIFRHAIDPLTLEQTALKIEQQHPEFDNHLINSLLLAEQGDEDSIELIRTVIQEGKAEISKVELDEAIPKKQMQRRFAAGLVAACVMAFYVIVAPDYFANALVRLFMPLHAPGPLTRTRIVKITPQNHNILAGENVQIQVKLDGWLPETAQVMLKPDGDEVQLLTADSDEDPSLFDFTVPEVNRAFSYRILAGDAKSASFRVSVQDRPVVSEWDLTVVPPEYTVMEPLSLKNPTITALPGSTVELRGTCSKPLAKARLKLSDGHSYALKIENERNIAGSFKITESMTYVIDLTDVSGFKSQPVDHEIETIVDDPPEIRITTPAPNVTAKPTENIYFQFEVTDQYGIKEAQIVRQIPQEQGEKKTLILHKWLPNRKDLKLSPMTHELPVSDLRIKSGATGTLQIIAWDWNDVTGPGVTRSNPILVKVLSADLAKEENKKALKQAAAEISEIISKQRKNISKGKELRIIALSSSELKESFFTDLRDSIRLQEEVREMSGAVLKHLSPKLPIQPVVKWLFENEMIQAVRLLQNVQQSGVPTKSLKTALDTEQVILTRLSGRNEQLKDSEDSAALRDILAALDELIRDQKLLREETRAFSKSDNKEIGETLADRQDLLSEKLTFFKEQLLEHAKIVRQSDVDTAARFEKAAKMIEANSVRSSMLLVASKLARNELGKTLPTQDEILKHLYAISKLLREPLVTDAEKKLEDLKELAREGKKKATRLAKLQAVVKEISEELERSKDLTDGENEVLKMKAEELKELKQNMADAIERMAKDLSLFPDLPACNELVERSREIFEDIEQKEGSEDSEVKEIAVDRDENMLEALKEVKERFADLEEWMMDHPDDIKWKQEGWDPEEMDIPLVDLPEELEDMVGDLVDQAEDKNEEAEDSTSNATLGDFPAGWDTMDGPLNSWGAKGKSGNERPNSNEMSGRSGAGREGNSNGEVVGKMAKDLEGTATKARRTHDPFQKGQIGEENPNQMAKATGGGKLSGIGGEGGLHGSAPARNELKMRDMARRQRNLKRNTSILYTKASLLYLPTGELDQALLLMDQAEKQAKVGDLRGFSETQRRIVHSLRNTQRTLSGRRKLRLDPRLKLPKSIREEMVDASDESIPPEYERLVSDYFKAISTNAVK